MGRDGSVYWHERQSCINLAGMTSGSVGAKNPFEFGKNWRAFLAAISEDRIKQAEAGLIRLFPNDELCGSKFLDIGCGSGLSMLAALRLGATHCHGIDVDPDSAGAAQELLSKYAPNGPWKVECRSVFDLNPEASSIVYSWGVLHHTGEMWRAITQAAALVPKDGLFALAIYQSTPLDPLWRVEKRFYSSAPKSVQFVMRGAYKSAFVAALLASGRNPARYIDDYRLRGMEWSVDVHDWLGGYPYESASAEEIMAALRKCGMSPRRVDNRQAGFGILSANCAEFVATRL
jgi:2-polyprenyl-6-hydroxyphenyl methylase/3-demethylubiquinone-9 3-methyltransferase